MGTHLGFGAVLARLFLTALLGGLLGLDRSEHGHSAGIRTTLLVGLAACVAMIQANLLMPTAGKASDSFVVLDLMRLPLGILTGVGFIGAGAIVRRGDRTQGVTTAASLWFVTVMGLCLGGGQLVLGTLTFFLGAAVLWPMRWLERRLPTIQRATLALRFRPGAGYDPAQLRRTLAEAHIGILSLSLRYENNGPAPVECELRVRGHFGSEDFPPALSAMAKDSAIASLHWRT